MSGVTTLDPAGEKFIAGWEGGQSSDGLYHAYWDGYGHVWTIGVGETHVNGGPVPPGLVWTQEQAFTDLQSTFARDYGPYINALGADPNQHQFNAAGDAIWNLGPGSLEWDWGRAFKARDFRSAASLLLNYDRAGGVVLNGLADRRRAEAALMLTPVINPPPKDPYAIYPKTTLRFRGRVFEEYRLAKRIDFGLNHPRFDHHELLADLSLAKAAKTRIWVVSVYEPPLFRTLRKSPDWGDDRGARYQLWIKRVMAMEKVLA